MQGECYGVTQALTREAVISSDSRVADVCSVNRGLEILQVTLSRIKKKM